MHLSNKELGILVSPFIVAGVLWIFNEAYIDSLNVFFEPVQPPYNSVVAEKGEAYRFIQQNKENYSTLLKKINSRESNSFWIAERLFNPNIHSISTISPSPSVTPLLPPPPLIPFSEGNISGPTQSWSVQMVLPEQNMAIINNRIIRVNQRIDGVQLLEVKQDQVLIKTTKGKQWVKLFH